MVYPERVSWKSLSGRQIAPRVTLWSFQLWLRSFVLLCKLCKGSAEGERIDRCLEWSETRELLALARQHSYCHCNKEIDGIKVRFLSRSFLIVS